MNNFCFVDSLSYYLDVCPYYCDQSHKIFDNRVLPFFSKNDISSPRVTFLLKGGISYDCGAKLSFFESKLLVKPNKSNHNLIVFLLDHISTVAF